MPLCRSTLSLLVAAALVTGCQEKGPTKEELEAAKNTVDCGAAPTSASSSVSTTAKRGC